MARTAGMKIPETEIPESAVLTDALAVADGKAMACGGARLPMPRIPRETSVPDIVPVKVVTRLSHQQALPSALETSALEKALGCDPLDKNIGC